MNLQQLSYILAVDRHRHFVTAASECHVTQATLSMMIKKLEEELGVLIFDRSHQPVIPTEIGEKILKQARTVLREADRISEIIEEEKQEINGEIKMGIIPTLAPYLLPLFLPDLLKKYPGFRLEIYELTTREICQRLTKGNLDIGILAIPLKKEELKEQSLFFEEFMVYAGSSEKLIQKKFVLAGDIDINRLWLLEEGHCLRSQIINLCELKQKEKSNHQFNLATGSMETLKKMVEMNQGITILPELAILEMTEGQRSLIRHFKSPAPVREIGLVTYRHFIKEKLIEVLKQEILRHIPESMHLIKKREVVDFE